MDLNKQRLEQLSTEQLEQLIREDAVDQEKILEILSILKARDSIDPTLEEQQTEAAWLEFQEHYNTEEGKGASLYPIGDEEKAKKQKNRAIIRFSKIAVAVAAVLLLIGVIPPALGAESVFHLIAQWSREVFTFETAGSVNKVEVIEDSEFDYSTDNPDLQKIYDLTQEMGATVNVVPSWIPDGFEMVELMIENMETADYIATLFNAQDGNTIKLSAYVHDNCDSMGDTMYGKNDIDVELTEINGIDYYLMENSNQNVAVWTVNNITCTITTSLSMEELLRIVNSIYEVI